MWREDFLWLEPEGKTFEEKFIDPFQKKFPKLARSMRFAKNLDGMQTEYVKRNAQYWNPQTQFELSLYIMRNLRDNHVLKPQARRRIEDVMAHLYASHDNERYGADEDLIEYYEDSISNFLRPNKTELQRFIAICSAGSQARSSIGRAYRLSSSSSGGEGDRADDQRLLPPPEL